MIIIRIKWSTKNCIFGPWLWLLVLNFVYYSIPEQVDVWRRQVEVRDWLLLRKRRIRERESRDLQGVLLHHPGQPDPEFLHQLSLLLLLQRLRRTSHWNSLSLNVFNRLMLSSLTVFSLCLCNQIAKVPNHFVNNFCL